MRCICIGQHLFLAESRHSAADLAASFRFQCLPEKSRRQARQSGAERFPQSLRKARRLRAEAEALLMEYERKARTRQSEANRDRECRAARGGTHLQRGRGASTDFHRAGAPHRPNPRYAQAEEQANDRGPRFCHRLGGQGFRDRSAWLRSGAPLGEMN